MSPCPVFVVVLDSHNKRLRCKAGASWRKTPAPRRASCTLSKQRSSNSDHVGHDGSDLNNFWERGYQAHGASSATKALLCEPGHNLHFCTRLKDFITRHKVKSKGRARWRNGGSPGSQLWHTLDRVAADGIKFSAAKNTMSNSAKQWKSSQHIGKCTKSKYTSYISRVPPPFEGSSRKAANNSGSSQWTRLTRCAPLASTVALSRKSLVVCVGSVQKAYCSRKPQSS